MNRVDDMQDFSSMRRGRPSTHTIFGLPWTMNSGSYIVVEALDELRKMGNAESLSVFIGEILGPESIEPSLSEE